METDEMSVGRAERRGEDKALSKALQAARDAPQDVAAWEHLESVAASSQRPDEVAELFREVLQGQLSRELAESVGQRAVQWLEEWFGEDAPPLVQVLNRVLELNPGARWAFQRLTVVHTAAGRWNDLLALYDRALESAHDDGEHAALLEEAANAAKDFAGSPSRAIDYMQKLISIKPTDSHLATSLERLLEREDRFEDLITFWTQRLEHLSAESDGAAVRVRIAETYLNQLSRPAEALEEVRRLVEGGAQPPESTQLLESISTHQEAQRNVRRSALNLLRQQYASRAQGDDVVRTILTALELADEAESVGLRREAGQRLVELERYDEAMQHFAALLKLDPLARDAVDQLRDLAQRLGARDKLVEALVEAANACEVAEPRIELRVEAADLRRTALEDPHGAIDLYRAVLEEPDCSPSTQLSVARRLADLSGAVGEDEERLAVLERLAELEPEPAERRSTLGHAARAAEKVGDADRALRLWQQRTDEDSGDLEALDATISILQREERWEPLVRSLAMRAGAGIPPHRRRTDLVRIARIEESNLDRIDEAITTWSKVADEFGENPETVDALASLLSKAGRPQELSELLGRAADREADHVASIYSRIGDVQRTELDSPRYAAEAYASAVRIEPGFEAARAGLLALLDDPSCRGGAAEALASAFALTDEWEKILELLEHRLESTERSGDRVRLLREAASLQEQRGEDNEAALHLMRRAMGLAPELRDIEADVFRLAELTGGWSHAVDAIREAVQALGEDAPRSRYLRFWEGKLCEGHVQDPSAALVAYDRVFSAEPTRLEAAAAVVRTGGRSGTWSRVADALVEYARARGEVSSELVDETERVAAELGAWDDLAVNLEAAVKHAKDLPLALGRDLERQLAQWHLDRREDEGAAAAALARAVRWDGGHLETLEALADLQRRDPGPPLYETLILLADRAEEGDLAPLREASELAITHAEDRGAAKSVLERLYRQATRLWRQGRSADGQPPDQAALWALERLVDLYTEGEEASRAVSLLSDAAQLPVARDAALDFRRRAASIAMESGDRGRAIVLYREIIDDAPDDAASLAQLAEACRGDDQLPEMLSLLQRELSLCKEPERRLELRLEMVRVVGELERRGGSVDSLRENLEERPGHEPTIEALEKLLQAGGRHAELVQVLGDQAEKLRRQGDADVAARLWSKVADVSETQLDDVAQALAAHRRVVELSGSVASLHVLARLHTERGEAAAAAQWLSRLLGHAAPGSDERADTALRLARAHLGAQQSDQAMSTLEQALSESPERSDLREMLAEQYRAAERFEPLAQLLTDAAPHVHDPASVVAYASEAADLYERLGSLERAIPILEKAATAAPDERDIRVRLASGLRIVDRHEEARALLEEVIESYGRRRNAERASVHFQLAQVARSQGALATALEQLEQASKMDVSNPQILRALGDTAQQLGDVDRAERAYRALLLVVRRQHGDQLGPVGAGEVLYELHRTAAQRGDEAQSKELLESAMDAAIGDDEEAQRLKATLLQHEQAELAKDVLERRLAQTDDQRAEARLLASLAEVLDEALNRGEEALDRALESVKKAPNDEAVLQTVRALAHRLGATPRFLEVLESAVVQVSENEPAVASGLLMKAGQIAEEDLGDLSRAADLFRRVEVSEHNRVEAWRALARVSQKQGHTAEVLRALDRIIHADDVVIAPSERIDALYQLAAVSLSLSDHREEGIATLKRALEAEPRNAQAGAMLRDVTANDADAELLELYERVARQSGDPHLLLDCLEKRASTTSATLHEIREAVGLAVGVDERGRAERLLQRGVELAHEVEGGLGAALWLPKQLAELRREAGDVAGAVHWMTQAAEVADEDQSFDLWLSAAGFAASEEGDLAVARQAYERLFEHAPDDRRVWEPFLDVLCRAGDEDRLNDISASLLDGLLDPGARSAVRVVRARYLLSAEGREPDAADVLREVLEDDPEHQEAAQLLADLFERTGYDEDLVELLGQQLDLARDNQDLEAIRELSLRLGGLLEKVRREDAMDVYRRALDWLPEDRPIAEALLALLGPDDDPREQIEVQERLLATDQGETAAGLAMELAARWEQLGEPDGVMRVLRLGYRGCPDNDAIRERLEQWYRAQEQWPALAELMMTEARRLEVPGRAVPLLREAAKIFLDQLGDSASAGAALADARALAPQDVELLAELARCRSASGEHQAALEEVTQALEVHAQGSDRVTLLRMRAQLRLEAGLDAEAIVDLEEAYSLAGSPLASDLAAALERRREQAAQANDSEAERSASLRLGQLLAAEGREEEGRAVFAQWIDRAPEDREVLRLVRDLDARAGRWTELADICGRLVRVEEGQDQIDAVIRLADAWEQAGHPEAAREGLEYVNDQQGGAVVRERLRKLYEQLSAHRELGALLMQDAQDAQGDADRQYELLKAAGSHFLAAEDPDTAVGALEAAIQLRTDDHETTLLLVDCHIAAERYADAGRILELAIANHPRRRSPELSELQHRMAQLAAAAGDRGLQLQWLNAALDSDKSNGHVAAELATLAMELGEHDTALNALRVVTLNKTEGPMSRAMAFLLQARIAHQRGEARRALLWARKARSEDPDLEEAQEFLRQIGDS